MEAQGIVSDHSSNEFRKRTSRRDGGGHRNSSGYQQRWVPNESTGSSSSRAAGENKGQEGSGNAIVEIAGSNPSGHNGPPSVSFDNNRAWSKVHSVDTKPNHVQGLRTVSSSRRSSGVAGGSTGVMAAEQSFVAYLPQDDAVMAGLGEREGGVDAAEAQEVTDLLNEQLSALLCLPPRQFWKKVVTDESLSVFLDSYLHFRRRWFDSPLGSSTETKSGVVVGDGDLSRRTFMVLLRMSSNSDPGTPASESLSAKEHAAILKDKKLLDIPKLMDLAAIYGHDNPDLTRRLVSNVFKAQPSYADELAGHVSPLLQRIITMHQRCCDTVQALKGPRDLSTVASGDRVHQELLEIVDYLNDVVITLNAFILVYPPAANILVTSGNPNSRQGLFFPALATIHDTLLPNVQEGFAVLASSQSQQIEETAASAELRLNRLGERLVDIVWLLIENRYLGGSSGDDTSTVQTTYNNPYEDAVVKGDSLVQAVAALAMGPFESDDSVGSGSSRLLCSGSLLKNIERRYGLSYQIQQACEKGSLLLDDAQQDYLSALMVDDRVPVGGRGKEIVESKHNIPRLTLPEREGDEETVIRQSKISQIKDLFPEFGDGFVDACLEVYDNDPEKVIERILEGTLHPDLASLDTSIATKPLHSVKAQPVKDKGKGKIQEMPIPAESVWEDKPISLVGVSSSLSLAGSSSSGSASSGATPPLLNLPNPVVHPVANGINAGRYVRRQKGDDESFNDLLNSRSGNDDIRIATKAAAARVEYEDEYDDSFDELGQYVADTGGVEETESLADLVGSRGKARSENSYSRNSGRPSTITPWGGASSPRDKKFSGGAPSGKGEPQRGDRQHPMDASNGILEPPRGDRQYSATVPPEGPPRGDRQYSANAPRSNAEAQRGERRYPVGAPSGNVEAHRGDRKYSTGAPVSNEGQRGDRQYRPVNTFEAQKGDRQYSGGSSSSSNSMGYQFGAPVPEVEGQGNEAEANSAGSGRGRGGRGNRGRGKNRGPQPKSDFYLKDGKLYSYKVTGAIGVGSVEEAEAIKREEAVTIYGLGEGGNVPRAMGGGENDGKQGGGDNSYKTGPVGEGGRGRGGRGRGGPPGRGRGRGENDNHHRKDKAMKKHFSGLSGF